MAMVSLTQSVPRILFTLWSGQSYPYNPLLYQSPYVDMNTRPQLAQPVHSTMSASGFNTGGYQSPPSASQPYNLTLATNDFIFRQ